MKKGPLTFRMSGKIRFNREIHPKKDTISPGGFEIMFGRKIIPFDFEEFCGGRVDNSPFVLEFECKNPMYNDFPKLHRLKKKMFDNISDITDFFIYTETEDETDLLPVALEELSFTFPYDNWDTIKVPGKVLKNASFQF